VSVDCTVGFGRTSVSNRVRISTDYAESDLVSFLSESSTEHCHFVFHLRACERKDPDRVLICMFFFVFFFQCRQKISRSLYVDRKRWHTHTSRTCYYN